MASLTTTLKSMEDSELLDVEINDHVFPEEAYVLSGALIGEKSGVNVPQTFLHFSYRDSDGEMKSITFALETWAAIKLGLSLGQASVGATETMSEAHMSQSPAAPRPKSASPYI